MKKRILTTIMTLGIAGALVIGCGFSACDQPVTEETKCTRPLNEGVDTQTEITGYTDHASDIFPEKGDKIAVISPSSTPSRKQTDSVIKGLKDWGYLPVEGKYTCVEERTLQDCIDDLTWALENPEIKAIFCVRGGYAANEVMDTLPVDLVKNAHKPIIGFSDITIYHSAMITAGLPNIHASMSGAFSDLPENCTEAEQNIIQGKIPNYKCEANEYCKEGTAEGILIGGNLSTFLACLGTEYDPTQIDEPYILFLEDVEEDLQHIHRCLTVLKHMGVLDKAQGIVFGEWTDNPEDANDYNGNSRGGEFTSVADMINRQFAAELDIPIAYGFPAGHGDVNYPLLMGEKVTLSVENDNFSLQYQYSSTDIDYSLELL